MKSLARFRSSSAWTFFANRPSALERAVRPSPKSRRLRLEPLENRALLAVDAFGGAASLIDSDVGATWGPDPEPAAFSASVLATDAAIVDVSAVGATLADALFSVQVETPEPVAPPSFEQLMEALGQVKIESLGDESDAASLSYLDEAASATQLLNSLNLQDISQGTPRQVVFYDSSDADFDESSLNLDDESVYYVDAAEHRDTESYSATSRSGGGSNSGGSGGSSNSGGSTSVVPSDYQFTTYGSTTIFESATYDSSGGSNQGPFFAFTTPASIPSGYEAFVRFEANGAIYGHDYYVSTASVVDGVATPQHSLYYSNPSQGNYDLYVSGGTSYCIIPMNDNVLEAAETLVATFYLVNTNSGGADYDPTPIACSSFNATIIDDSTSVSVYWDNGLANNPNSATLSGNPNGGGVRVFPELANFGDSCPKQFITLRFKLNEESDQAQTIYYKLCDPDNFISLGKNQSADDSYTPNDNNQTSPLLKRALDEIDFSDFAANQTLSLTFQPGETEKTLVCAFQQAYAGDNFIVIAGLEQATVAAAQLGTTVENRYKVVQSTSVTESSKLAQTQNLTVWRTLWAELDCLAFNQETADAPLIDGMATEELARACVDLKELVPNDSPYVSSLAKELTKGYMQSLGLISRNAYSISWFWTTRLIGAFSFNNDGLLGNYEDSNNIFIYNDTHETLVTQWNERYSTDFDVNFLKRRTALHEIGHALSLEHTNSTVMLGCDRDLNLKVSLDVLFEPDNLVFSTAQLAQIQSLEQPTAPESSQKDN